MRREWYYAYEVALAAEESRRLRGVATTQK